ncbi:MAG: amidohydrolase [Anaerolineae bacterium]|nr:amidohydrolase [Anaerolineae bacterium]
MIESLTRRRRSSPPVTLRGALIDGRPRDLHVAERVLAGPAADALTVDLDGYALFPGLINAHDHLELNHYPRTKFRERYANAHDWGEDVNAHLDDEPFASLRALPLADRCFIGGLKNLLSGALTVVQHNPPHKCLFQRDFPVRVLHRYGWAHSLHFASDAEIVRSFKATPRGAPWFLHLAEGTDEIAASEYARLKALGCVDQRTVLIHGVGLSETDAVDVARRVRGLVVCPTTNAYLLGTGGLHDSARAFAAAGGTLALGSDSRLTADGDLLDEIRAAGIDPARAWASAARLLGMNETPFAPGTPADFIAYRADAGLADLGRAGLALIVRDGSPQIGDPALMAQFPHVQTIPALLDGQPKRVNLRLAQQIARCAIHEPGLEIDGEDN